MPCPLCETRKPKRQCPALGQLICAPCCGTYREVTVDCPETCPHLIASRRHDRADATADPGWQPIAPEVRIPERFVAMQPALVAHLSAAIAQHWRSNPTVADPDVLACLTSLVQTLTTLRAGIIYETRPMGPLRAGLFDALQSAWRNFQALERNEMAMQPARDADFEMAIVLLARLAQYESNGRPRSRRALARLVSFAPNPAAPEPANLLVAP